MSKIDTLLTMYIEALKEALANQTKDKLVESLAEILVGRIDLNSKSDLEHMVQVVRKHKGGGKAPEEHLDYITSQEPRKSLDDIKTVINTINLFCTSFGWDGNTAEAVSPTACNVAKYLTEHIHPVLDYESDAPIVTASRDGGVIIAWQTERGVFVMECVGGDIEWDFESESFEASGIISTVNEIVDKSDLDQIVDLIMMVNVPEITH